MSFAHVPLSHRVRQTVVALSAAIALLAATPLAAQAVSPGKNGRVAYELEGAIYSVQPSGAGTQQLTAGPDDHNPSWSPDGSMIAFERAGDIWLMRANGTHQTRFTSGPGDDVEPTWSADGKQIYFVRSDDGSEQGRSLFAKPVAGGVTYQLVSSGSDGCASDPVATSDGRYVVFVDTCPVLGGGTHRVDLLKYELSTRQVTAIIDGGFAGPGGTFNFAGTAPDITPDGTHVVFTVADPADLCGVGVTDLSGGGFRRIEDSADCGVFLSDDPAISPDGKKIAITVGNENPRLTVLSFAKSDQDENGRDIAGGRDFPLNAAWQSK